jgi:hypothetical protein
MRYYWFKEIHNKGFVNGVDIGADTSEYFEFMSYQITFRGRKFLASSIFLNLPPLSD